MRTSKLSDLFLTTALAMGMSGQALALDVGQKGSFAVIEKELSQERQVEFARAKYVLNPGGPGKSKTLCVKFTINANGDAYILMSDSMDDSTVKIEMVYGKMKNARVYDPKNIGVLPQGVSEQSNLANMIKHGAAAGDGVLIHGQSVKKLPNGSDDIVGLTTVMGNTLQNAGFAKQDRVVIFLTSNDGVISLDKVVASELKYRAVQAK